LPFAIITLASMKVFLSGATGFVGSHLAARLIADGHKVRTVVRDRYAAQAKLDRRVNIVSGDLVSGGGLGEAIAGCDAVIHLVGIIVEKHRLTFERAHVVTTRNLLDAAKAVRVRRWIQMSALGARRNGVSRYQTTKWEAEELVRGSGMQHAVLRPSIIYGPRDGFVSQMVDVMRKSPLVRPVPGNGRYRFRPIYIDTVVDCFMQALTGDRALGKAVELVGPEELTLEKMLAEIASCVGIRKPAVKVPMPIMYLNAALLSVLPKPPVTIDQLKMLREGSTADPGPMRATFDVNPIGFREGLMKYLCARPTAS
jgi:NADH dehydrogenase